MKEETTNIDESFFERKDLTESIDILRSTLNSGDYEYQLEQTLKNHDINYTNSDCQYHFYSDEQNKDIEITVTLSYYVSIKASYNFRVRSNAVVITALYAADYNSIASYITMKLDTYNGEVYLERKLLPSLENADADILWREIEQVIKSATYNYDGLKECANGIIPEKYSKVFLDLLPHIQSVDSTIENSSPELYGKKDILINDPEKQSFHDRYRLLVEEHLKTAPLYEGLFNENKEGKPVNMNENSNEKNENEKLFSIDEIEDIMVDNNRKRAEPILQKISTWIESLENMQAEDILTHPILVIPIKNKFTKYYMQVLLDNNNIKIAAAIKFDNRNRRRVCQIIDEINANTDDNHLGYAHAYIPKISTDLYISYMYEFDFSDSDKFDPEKHFAKYWFSIISIVDNYYKDIMEIPSYNTDPSRPHGSVMDKFLATVQGDIDFLNPCEKDEETFLKGKND